MILIVYIYYRLYIAKMILHVSIRTGSTDVTPIYIHSLFLSLSTSLSLSRYLSLYLFFSLSL